jgi:ABC-type transport system involved in cytochrome c biogenesis permease subunit
LVIFKLCIPLGTTLELLHLLFRWHLSSASPLGRLWSFFTFYFGGILALHSLRNDF